MRLREREEREKKVSKIIFCCWWSSQITAWKQREKTHTAFTSYRSDGQNKKKSELFLIMAIGCFKVEK